MLIPLERYLQWRQERGSASLRAEVTSPMLAIFAPDVEAKAGFRTITDSNADVARKASALALSQAELRWDADGAFAAPVRKAADSPWGDRISVGRARNTDICIPEASLSKLHAHLVVNEDGSFAVIDTDSKNGVYVNKVRIKPNEPHPIRPGDMIFFGGVVAIFHTPESFTRFVHLLDAGLKNAHKDSTP